MKSKYIPFIVLLILLISNIGFSQNNTFKHSDKFAWITLGAGRFSGQHILGYGGYAGFTFISNFNVFSLRYSTVSDASVSPAGRTALLNQNEKVIKLNDINLLYGINYKMQLIYTSISAGLGYAWGKKDNGQKQNAIEFPVELSAFFTPLKVLGIGIKYILNFNQISSVSGILFCVQLGKIN